MELISTPLAVVLVVGGAGALLAATVVARREPLPARRGASGRFSLLVPWIFSLLAVVLLVRGAFAGAAFVAVATLLYASVQRVRALREGDRR